MTKVGEHITLDIIGTTKEYDPVVFEKVINDIAKAAKVTILNISKYKFEPQGFTILALLAESHISFHTFPEKGIISFDFFTCGKVNPCGSNLYLDMLRIVTFAAFAISLITFSNTSGSYSFVVPMMSRVMCSPTLVINYPFL